MDAREGLSEYSSIDWVVFSHHHCMVPLYVPLHFRLWDSDAPAFEHDGSTVVCLPDNRSLREGWLDALLLRHRSFIAYSAETLLNRLSLYRTASNSRNLQCLPKGKAQLLIITA